MTTYLAFFNETKLYTYIAARKFVGVLWTSESLIMLVSRSQETSYPLPRCKRSSLYLPNDNGEWIPKRGPTVICFLQDSLTHIPSLSISQSFSPLDDNSHKESRQEIYYLRLQDSFSAHGKYSGMVFLQTPFCSCGKKGLCRTPFCHNNFVHTIKLYISNFIVWPVPL